MILIEVSELPRCELPLKALNGAELCRCELPRRHHGAHYGVARSGTRCSWKEEESGAPIDVSSLDVS
jgi:hypothetical protein